LHHCFYSTDNENKNELSNAVDLICRRITESEEKMKNHILDIDGKLDETEK
jgi:hypothetical protein